MHILSADWALLPQGWARNVRLSVNAGVIAALETDAQRAPTHVSGALLPGLVNLHSHAFQRSFAGRTEYAGGGGDFWSWREAMYRAAGALEPETLAPVTAYLGMQLLRGGFTSLVEFHYLQNAADGQPYAHRPAMAEAVIEGAQQAGIGLTLLFGIYQHGNFGGAPLSAGQKRFAVSADEALHMLDSLRAETGAMLRFGLAPHSLRAVSPEALGAAEQGLRAMDAAAPLHIHVAEQQAEIRDCEEVLRARPVQWLLDTMPVDERWCLIHATHTTDDERRRMAASAAVAGLCPATEANLGDGIFSLRPYLEAGGRFGIGTDSHVAVDAFQELRFLEASQRLSLQRRNILVGDGGHSGRALWERAAAGGAQAASRPVGRIEPGARADLVAISSTPETDGMAPDYWLDATILTAVPGPAARHVMVGGEWLVRDFTHVRQASIERAYTRALRKLWG